LYLSTFKAHFSEPGQQYQEYQILMTYLFLLFDLMFNAY